MITVKKKNIRVVLGDIGEGIDGDYNPEDKDDIPLLRFDVEITHEDGYSEALECASYCTQIPVATPKKEQRRLARLILDKVYPDASAGKSIKRLCANLSWINVTWGTAKERKSWILS